MKSTKYCIVLSMLLGVSVTSMLQARSCSDNADVLGVYGFYGSRGGTFLVGATAPGTTTAGYPLFIPTEITTAPVVGSNTPLGFFVASLAGNGAFGSNGRVYFDGAGGIYAASVAGSVLLDAHYGSYTVGADCSITIVLSDPFTAS